MVYKKSQICPPSRTKNKHCASLAAADAGKPRACSLTTRRVNTLLRFPCRMPSDPAEQVPSCVLFHAAVANPRLPNTSYEPAPPTVSTGTYFLYHANGSLSLVLPAKEGCAKRAKHNKTVKGIGPAAVSTCQTNNGNVDYTQGTFKPLPEDATSTTTRSVWNS